MRQPMESARHCLGPSVDARRPELPRLRQRKRLVIAFTGDGGLMMCLGELACAVQMQARIIVIVFNDESLSLIDIKQQGRGLQSAGVHFARTDFAAIMRSVGGVATRQLRKQPTGEHCRQHFWPMARC